MLWASIGNLSQKLLQFGFSSRLRVQFWASRYIMEHNQKSSQKLWESKFARSFDVLFLASRYIMGLKQIYESNAMLVWSCSELQHSISRVSIYYGTQSDIRVKSNCRLNWLRGSTFNFDRLDILRDSIRHPSKKLLPFELGQSFNIQFRAFRYITGLNRTSE